MGSLNGRQVGNYHLRDERADLVAPMRELVTRQAARLPRFMKQMAENALNNRAPSRWTP